MKKTRYTTMLLAVIAATALAFGGGCKKSSSTATDDGTGNQPVTVQLSGTASKGPIDGGTVNVHALNADGTEGTLLGTATTLADGSYSVSLAGYTGNVVAGVSGGAYTDEATNAVVTNTATFRAVLTDATGTVAASLTPITELAAANAGVLTTANISAANNKISTLLGGINILTIKPADMNASVASASQAEKDYGLLLAALSQMSKDSGKSIAEIITEINDDLADGKLNSTGATLSAAIITFLNSSNNKSGMTEADTSLATLVLHAIDPSDTTAPGAPADLLATAASTTRIDLTWTKASDDVAVTGYKVYRDGTYQKTSDGPALSDTGLTAKTKYCYQVSAIDAAYNESAKSAEVCATTKGISVGVTWTPHDMHSFYTMQDIAWSGKQFVAVAQQGKVYTSPDGIAWSNPTSGTILDLNGVAWSGQKFAVVGRGGTILTSTDGATWDIKSSGTTSLLNAITWSGSKFVAVGDSGTIVTSPDGATWTVVSTGTQYPFNGVAYGNGKFVAVPYKGASYSSPDGVTWTPGTQNPVSPWAALNAVAYGNGLFVAVSSSSTGSIFTSSDGSTWTERLSGATSQLNSITWSGSQFAAVGASRVICTSPDGITWTTRDSGLTNIMSFNSIIWADTQFAAVAYANNADASLFVTAP